MNSVTPQKRTTPATGEEEIAKKPRTEESDKPSTPWFEEDFAKFARKAMGGKEFLTPDNGSFGYIEGKRYGPDDPLPHGYVWVSYDPDLDYKDYIIAKECDICRIGGDHWTEECLKYDPNKKDAYCWP